MNREIKFRVWDVKHKKFYDRDDFVIEPDGSFCERRFSDLYDDTWLNPLNEEDYMIQQFIGLKDKNGVEIYEGDILKWESNSISHRLGECKRIRIVEVKWDQKSAAFIVEEIGHQGLIPAWKMDANDFNGKPFIKEVIGNVFENKGLLQA